MNVSENSKVKNLYRKSHWVNMKMIAANLSKVRTFTEWPKKSPRDLKV